MQIENNFLNTGKSMSEALIFASTNPKYGIRLFMKIENCKLRTSGEHDVYINCFFVFVLTLLGLGLIKINDVSANFNNRRPSLILNN